MRRAPGVAAIAFALALAGCDSTVGIVDAVNVDNVPACRTWPVELAGDTYWEMEEEQVAEWGQTHEDPFGGTPQPQASAAWPDDAYGRGLLYRYEDGTALFISGTGLRILFTDEEREFATVC